MGSYAYGSSHFGSYTLGGTAFVQTIRAVFNYGITMSVNRFRNLTMSIRRTR